MQDSISSEYALRQAIKETTTTLVGAVKSTLGPQGTNVGILSQLLQPVIINDGVTVSKSIVNGFKNPLKKYIANVLKTVSQNTDNIAGDGTTTSLTITEALIIEGIKNIEAGFSQVDIAKGIREAAIMVLKELDVKAIPVLKDKELLLNVATVSANNDPELGKVISEAFLKVGINGQISIQDSVNKKTYVEVVNGMEFDSGYQSNMFINTKSTEVVFGNTYILLYEGKLISIDPIVEALKKAREEDFSILIIADDFSKEVIEDLTYNKLNANVKVCAVRSPSYGQLKEQNIDDLSLISGATIISRRFGSSIENFECSQLGKVSFVKISADSFSIINSEIDKESLHSKIESLKKELERALGPTAKEEFQNRIARLSNGVAVMYVSGSSPVEIAEKKYRIEDAINATRASLEEGVVPGGGVTLLRIANNLKMPKLDNRSQEIGFNILVEAMESPIRTITKNAGKKEDIIVETVLKNKNFNYGYDAKDEKYLDLVKKGIVDPVKVTKAALTNAASVSQMLLTMNVCVYE